MERVAGIFKRTPDVTDSLTTLIKEKTFQDSLKGAGSIGALIAIGIELYGQIRDGLKTDEERAFGSLIKIAFEAASESLPANSTKISIKNAKSENSKSELFNTFIKPEERWNSYLPDHPVIIQFRSLICDILRNEGLNDAVRGFVFNFNLKLEDKADKDPAIEPFKKRSTLHERNKDLIKHLESSRSLIYNVNPVDKKSINEYYIENNAILDDIKSWEEAELSSDKKSKAGSLIDKFLTEEKWWTIIGAPFGIGKTSLCIKLTSSFASKYLDNPNDGTNYIPIFVPLKGNLENIDEDQRSLDEVMELIAPGEEGKKRKILLICDGLDECGFDVDKLFEKLREKHREFPNVKVVITTRLEAELPQRLISLSSYIRLLHFDNDQIDQFFKDYGLSSITFDSLKSYIKEEDMRKPLFCWMFAIMMNSKSDSEIGFKDVENPSIKRALVYLRFIHSIIRGKHEHTAEIYHWTQYYPEEKSILRKIAALAQIHDRKFTRSTVIEGLKNYGIVYDEKMIKDVLEPILTSYFYLHSTSAIDMLVDFIHKSFGEYLLAEYYIESIFEDKAYNLSVGIPSQETIEFLDGLLELLNEKESGNQFGDLVNSLAIFQLTQRQISKSDFIERVRRFFEEEQIIFQTDSFSEPNKIWKLAKFPAAKYSELWIHRWISHYILNKLAEKLSRKETLEVLIQATSHTVPYYLKRLVKADLSYSDLPFANLANANLSRADFSHANLSGSNLTHANLLHANLSDATLFANLSDANLAFANLSYANLSDANLSGANLFHANLAYANLSDANLSGAILAYANLSNANLSYANLTNADLSNTDLSNTIQSNAILPPSMENHAQ